MCRPLKNAEFVDSSQSNGLVMGGHLTLAGVRSWLSRGGTSCSDVRHKHLTENDLSWCGSAEAGGGGVGGLGSKVRFFSPGESLGGP